jgi:ubiquinone/menaquinone biosynthesis C-methylase UbiE
MEFSNVYDDEQRARAYDALEFPGTYYLAYRDLPKILEDHVRGKKAVDFGCGTGRSTRFLKRLGYEVIGVDVSQPMLAKAQVRDPQGDYRHVSGDDMADLPSQTFDLVLAAFTFDNVATFERKVALFKALRRLVHEEGRIVNVVSSPEIYVHEWASFTTKEYPENRHARSGDKVRIVMLDVADRRPVEDILWTDASYAEVYGAANLVPVLTHSPLGREDDPCHWVSEAQIAPWTIYVLATEAKVGKGGSGSGCSK